MDELDGLRLLLLPHAVAMHLLGPDKAPGIAHAIALAQDHAAGCDLCPHWLEPVAGVLPRPPYWQIVSQPHPVFSSSAPVRHVLDVVGLARLGEDALSMYVRLAHRHEVAHDDTIDLIPSLLVSGPAAPIPGDADG